VRAHGVAARRRRFEDLLDRRPAHAALDRAEPDQGTFAGRRVCEEDRISGDVRQSVAAEDELLDLRYCERAFRVVLDGLGAYPCPCFAASFAFFFSCRSLIERLSFFFSFPARSPFGIVVLLLPLRLPRLRFVPSAARGGREAQETTARPGCQGRSARSDRRR
jgi:hypothetical protein